MAWSRREFMGMLFGAGAMFRFQGKAADPDSLFFDEEDKVGFSILQGMTDETSAQFSLVLPADNKWTIEISPNLPLSSQSIVTREYSAYVVYKIVVEGLQLGHSYMLRVLDEKGMIQDERQFQALDLDKADVKLSFASCANDHVNRDDIWHQFEKQNPDMIFFLGDSVYADQLSMIDILQADPQQLWNRFVETRNRVAFYFQKKLKPVLATWDDHDFGGNNANSTYMYKEESRQVFETFFAQAARPALLTGPGVAKRLSAFGADFFLFDDRTFRGEWNTPNSRMFGDAQETWFFDNVGAKPTWLMNGSVYYGAYTEKDSFEGQYSDDFVRWIERLKKTEGLFCFASGDVHFSEIMDIEAEQLGYPTFEMVSSSIHSFAFPGHQWRFSNPRRRHSCGSHNFTVFEGNFKDAIEGRITAFTASNEAFSTEVSVSRRDVVPVAAIDLEA
jgi:alkaline phosphatase D